MPLSVSCFGYSQFCTMDTDLTSALELIKNSGIHQASKIKNLEHKIETLTSCLTDSEKTNQIMKTKLLQKNEETRLLSLELQQQANKIESFESKFESMTSCLAASERTSQILKTKLLHKKEETRILTVKLQQQMDIIEAINRNIENFHTTNAALQQEVRIEQYYYILSA
jgi:chromosome segregation ATPase